MAWPMSKDRADQCGMSDLKETEKRDERRDSRRDPSEWQAYLGLSPSDEGLHRLQRLASRFQVGQKSQGTKQKRVSLRVGMARGTTVPQHCRVALGKRVWTNRDLGGSHSRSHRHV